MSRCRRLEIRSARDVRQIVPEKDDEKTHRWRTQTRIQPVERVELAEQVRPGHREVDETHRQRRINEAHEGFLVAHANAERHGVAKDRHDRSTAGRRVT